jgi:ABC-type glutathione transport system ATPase component
MTHLVEVNGLNIRFSGERTVHAVNDLSFFLGEGEVLGLLGESGSGKSVTLRALMRLLPKKRTQIAGTVRVLGRDVLALDDEELSAFRGRTVSMIFQEPALALDPVYTIGAQDRGDRDAPRRQEPERGDGARWKCWKWCAFPPPSAGWTPIRTRCRAACGNGR